MVQVLVSRCGNYCTIDVMVGPELDNTVLLHACRFNWRQFFVPVSCLSTLNLLGAISIQLEMISALPEMYLSGRDLLKPLFTKLRRPL